MITAAIATPPPAEEDLIVQVCALDAQIDGLRSEKLALLVQLPEGRAGDECFTQEDRRALSDFGMCPTEVPLDIVAQAMSRLRHKSDGIPAYLTLNEARMIYAFRSIRFGGFGILTVETHEKHPVTMEVAYKGRFRK